MFCSPYLNFLNCFDFFGGGWQWRCPESSSGYCIEFSCPVSLLSLIENKTDHDIDIFE